MTRKQKKTLWEIIAGAIQAEGFDDADAAWAAFEAQTTTVSGEGQP